MKIIADTATLFAPAEGEAQGMTIVPVCVSIDGKTYQDYAEITSEAFLEKITAGGIPASSQPAIGDLLDVFEGSDEEMLVLTVGAMMDDTIHDEEYILRTYNYPILGKVPNLVNPGNKAYGYYSQNRHKSSTHREEGNV